VPHSAPTPFPASTPLPSPTYWRAPPWRPRACALAQTLAIVTMNIIELNVARDLLLSPLGMVGANAVFLTVVWYVALQRPGAARPT